MEREGWDSSTLGRWSYPREALSAELSLLGGTSILSSAANVFCKPNLPSHGYQRAPLEKYLEFEAVLCHGSLGVDLGSTPGEANDTYSRRGTEGESAPCPGAPWDQRPHPLQVARAWGPLSPAAAQHVPEPARSSRPARG